MKKIYLFRHGETDWNKKGINQGQADIELNKTGLDQAKSNAEMLKDFGIQYIYSSPLKRALKTAQILAEKINVEIEIIDGFKEINLGDMSEKSGDVMKEVLGEEIYKKITGGYGEDAALNTPFPNGESRLDLQNRVVKALDYICKNDKHDVIGIAAHAGVLNQVLRNFKFGDVSQLKNCEVIEAEYDESCGFRICNRMCYQDFKEM